MYINIFYGVIFLYIFSVYLFTSVLCSVFRCLPVMMNKDEHINDNISSSGPRELTDVQSGIVPADDVRVSGVELSVTRLHQFVVVVLQHVPDINAVRHYLISTTDSSLYILPAAPNRRARGIRQSINQSLFANAISQVNKKNKCDRLPEQAIAQQSWSP